MDLIKGTVDKLPLLVELNKQLYEDGKNDNIPAIDVLEERMN